MSDTREDLGILLSEYLDSLQSEWVYREIEGKPDDYKVEIKLTRPEGGTIIVRTDADVIRLHVNATVQTIEAESLDE